MFQEADCLLITKIDLAPYLDINLDDIANNVRQMNPDVTIFSVSAKTEIGLDLWFDWLLTQVHS
jgi:hydrogenase nickel incorporation protein HypB